MKRFFLQKILTVVVIVLPVCLHALEPLKIDNCEIKDKSSKRSEIGRSCTVFKSGRTILERCDNTKCTASNVEAAKRDAPYCTTTLPTSPSFNAKKQVKADLPTMLYTLIASRPPCDSPYYEVGKEIQKERANLKDFIPVEDTDTFEFYKYLTTTLDALSDCDKLRFAKAGYGPIIFQSPNKGEKIFSVAIMDEDEVYSPCFK